MDSDNGYEEPGLLRGEGTLQVPSNVTRISRCFKRKCADGKLQIINYESGVGTGSNMLDSITGGAFGLGLSEVSIWEQPLARTMANNDSACEKLIPTCVQTTWMAMRLF